MAITRVSTMSLHQRNLRDIANSQTSIANFSQQISSGNKASAYADLSQSGNVEKVLSFESRMRTADSYIDSNIIISNRLLFTSKQVDNIIDIAENYRNQLVARRSSSGNTIPLGLISNDSLSQIQDALNANSEGRYVFAGSKTSELAVNNLLTESNIVNEEATGSYYNGDEVNLSVKVSETLSIQYGVTANHSGFQKLIGSINLGKENYVTNDDETAQKAVDMINDAISELIQLRVDINNNIATVDKSSDQHKDTKLYLSEVVSEITSTDIPSASIQLATHQTVLQAIFQTFARISQLTLNNYLK